MQAKAAQDREERQRKLSTVRKSVADDRKAAVERQKEESKRLEDLASQGRTYTELEKRIRAEEGRKRHEVVKKQKDRERKMKEDQAMRDYVRKMEEEAARKRQAEEMMTLLERQERELLERLRKSQQDQQEVRVQYLYIVDLHMPDYFISLLFSSGFLDTTEHFEVLDCGCWL